ncbi:MAG: hypothetical protein MJ092_03300 [Lachnospiraceae bacterium]|nr:hypothetical protein [Lachnospiraceae bacterium]
MKKTSKAKLIAALILNIFIIGTMVYSLVVFFTGIGDGNMAVHGTRCFMFFTIDSNLLMALASIVSIICLIKQLKDNRYVFPKSVTVFNLIATAGVTITFLVVLCFLGPISGYLPMYAGTNLFMHALNPIAAIILYMFLQTDNRMTLKNNIFGIITTIVYGTVYAVMVIFIGARNGGWYDFYHFNIGGFWYISYIVMQGVALGVSVLLSIVHNKMLKRSEK